MVEENSTAFGAQLDRELAAATLRFNCGATLDILFLAYLRCVSRFGYFTLGPITIDVHLIDQLVQRTALPGPRQTLSEDFVRFSRVLMTEVRRSGRKPIDELHYLFAFMRCGEGLPGRVFAELAVTIEQIDAYLKAMGGAKEPVESLMTPEEVADYLRVSVQTVRAWIRSGRLPARRLAGLRALRVRTADANALLEPLDEPHHSP